MDVPSHDLRLTKEMILDAAEQVLRRFGPDKTSVVDIAKVLQVSHGTLYRHFPSKAALCEAVTQRWLQGCISAPLEEIAKEAQGSATERLHRWLTTLRNSKKEYFTTDAEMFAMYASETEGSVEMVKAHAEHLVQQIAGIVEQGIQAKELKPGHPETIARAIFLATSRFHHPAHAQHWLADEEEDGSCS
ncbi:TetR/AcrR family transcriptional regulator [Brevibacillus nitrificans]|uniref:TetR/AcrR family transcriptional regulator n=1 Tax=Brevibacillus nitrificans TaxID=651560 RepID=UPI00285EDA72|nr:TetR/AcrR family transcriptional regulator [Brevibacillus nitrificans]MDR7315872.1 AcrR family transcriptional regulator [Brevibacillus nitrificans]